MSKRSYEVYDAEGKRKYLTRAEGIDFLRAAAGLEGRNRLFCVTVYFLGCRISEAVGLSKDDLDQANSVIRIRCLKKRGKVVFRRIPVPDALMKELATLPDGKLWPFSRYTGWRIIKAVMADAGIVGIHATPRGLRHAFGVRGAMGKIPVNCIQRWMGHASPLTTAIYLAVRGDEERELIERTWDVA